MIYQQLPKTYCDDTLADAMYARELEYFHYDFDRINFEQLLAKLPDGEYRTNIQERLNSTIQQMHYVDLIYQALAAQVSDPQAHEDAVARGKARREAVKAVPQG